jgi:beta-carotene ketolase (CrtO type)
MTTYDAVIVGGGHNGLVCAAYLAKEGKKVVVLEANPRVGGMASTKELAGAPGFKVNEGAMEFLTTGVEPSVVTELGLERFGLRWTYPQVITTWLGPEGQSMSFWKDRAKVVEEIKKYSRRDAQNYERLVDAITAALMPAVAMMQSPPNRLHPPTIFETLKQVAKYRKNLGTGARVMLGSIESVLEEFFEREEVKTPLATYSLASFAPISEPGSALYLSILTGAHEWGIKRAIGGTGMFSEAVAARLRSDGGEVRLNARAASINVHNGRAESVTLDGGEEVCGDHIIAAVDPWTLVNRLLDPTIVPIEVTEQMRGLQVSHHDIYIFKADAALSKRPTFPNHPGVPLEAQAVIGLCPSMDHLRKSVYKATSGDYDPVIPMYTACPSILDRSMVPEGSDGESFYLYGFNVPYELSDGRTWDAEKKAYWDSALDYFETVSPGTRDSVIDVELNPPPELERKFNTHRGNYSHVDMTLTQMGPWRPVPALAGNQTPFKGLWHCSAGSYPMPYLNGWPGRSAARQVLRQGSDRPHALSTLTTPLLRRTRPRRP